jgi:hypothetical protein
MTEPTPRPLSDLLIAAVLGGLVSGVAVGGCLMMVPDLGRKATPIATEESVSATPATDALEGVRCPRGMTRTVQVRGLEDGFARAGEEPAEIDGSLLQFQSYADLKAGVPSTQKLRAFDEGGVDKVLLHHFDVPKGAVSGSLILRVRGVGGGADNDYIGLTPSKVETTSSGRQILARYTHPMSDARRKAAQGERDDVVTIPLSDFVNGNGSDFPDVLSHLGALTSAGDPARLNLTIFDDTIIDMAGLALCVEPEIDRGVTFSEVSTKPAGPDISVLGCSIDESQSFCGPYQGDMACDQALPLACYKDGTQPKPEGLREVFVNDATFVGGEVRATTPVPGRQFKTLEDANAFCVATFGEGWRTLSYQEGGGAVVTSRSKIAPRTRVWIDIRDQPWGRCWDRPARGQIIASEED